MRRAAWILVCVLWTAAAGDFAGLTPGVSTKADVDRVLGAPVREVVPGERYEYNPARHDAVRISVKFRRGAGIVETIDLYPQGSYAKAQYRQWFKLEAPDKPVIDERGNLIEYYAGPGIALNYSGPDDTSPVAFFSHFELRILLEETPQTPAPGPPQQPAPGAPQPPAPAPAATRAYLGVRLAPHAGQGLRIVDVGPGSPAAKAGLRSGDLILEFDRDRFYDKAINLSAIPPLVGNHPVNTPLRVVIERAGRRFEAAVTLEGRDDSAIREENRKLAMSLHTQGRERLDRGDHDAAISLLRQAIQLRGPDVLEVSAFEDLGFCYFKKKRYAEALSTFQFASRIDPRSPATVYFLGASHDALGHREEAMKFYQAYLGLNHSHNGWNRFARYRLKALPREPEKDKRMRENLDKLLGAIQQEIRRK